MALLSRVVLLLCVRLTPAYGDDDATPTPPTDGGASMQQGGGMMAKDGFLQTGSKESGSLFYVTPTQLAESDVYPGVDYLGLGYDLVHGNPHGSGRMMLDPGFRQPVRRMDYTENWRTRDGKYRTATGTYALPVKSCYRSEEYSNVASASSYAQSLSVDASLEAEAGFGATYKGAFKASFGYKQAEEQSKQSESYRFDSTSYCNKYFVAWLHSSPRGSELQPQFKEAALKAFHMLQEGFKCKAPQMLSKEDIGSRLGLAIRNKWLNLFEVYGTHFVTELTLGGKCIYSRYIKKEAIQKKKSQDVSADVSASGKSLTASVSASISMDLSRSSSSQASSEVGGSSIIVIGGVPVGDASTLEGFAAWADTVSTNPMPTK